MMTKPSRARTLHEEDDLAAARGIANALWLLLAGLLAGLLIAYGISDIVK